MSYIRKKEEENFLFSRLLLAINNQQSICKVTRNNVLAHGKYNLLKIMPCEAEVIGVNILSSLSLGSKSLMFD